MKRVIVLIIILSASIIYAQNHNAPDYSKNYIIYEGEFIAPDDGYIYIQGILSGDYILFINKSLIWTHYGITNNKKDYFSLSSPLFPIKSGTNISVASGNDSPYAIYFLFSE